MLYRTQNLSLQLESLFAKIVTPLPPPNEKTKDQPL